MNLKIQKRTTEDVLLTFEADVLLRLVGYVAEEMGIDVEHVVASSAYVEVPGGGDWSNRRLSIDDAPLHVKLTIVKNNQTEA